ncbi:NAD(P)H-dependent oxidoreductase [Streptomyces sp. ODS28]|uniref:NAD(P)H-dependent oxidoreductase n=1 Tax=Streptomyces sp. ODS28 TaxID=3136688 RepID=UPI0031E58FB1
MKILWVFAHPEPRSMNASLLADGLDQLSLLGHETRVSDLYAMRWDPVLGPPDLGTGAAGRLYVGKEQERAFREGGLSPDVRAEQEKLEWADAVVFQFPLWWLGPPAILKGWFDRVLTQGFAFGLRDGAGRALRYGDGGLRGRRALVITSYGARESAFGPRGVHGQLDEVLFPLLHGTFWYTGMRALRPFAVDDADRMSEADYKEHAERLRARLRALDTETPIPYRHEAGGDYDERLTVRAELAPGREGLAVHRTG